MFMRNKRICCRYRYGLRSGAIRNLEIDAAAIEIGYFSPYSGICPPSAILAMRLSHPLHGSLLPPGICYTCDVCGKTLSTKLTLKRHKEQQHFQPLNSAVCALCHKVFRTLNSLNNHKSIYHRRQK
ncbi:Broad-complex core protein isoform 6 [Trachymyrmex cornetzi]|uniref:Broad-complex core protein isoform 6 n=1 Tax=Trachymyrmex cornetzi TaxID=471704 RepID=A0A195DJ66_9HYME|nr:Broad-complex core protein isoform 6 [Trachymyrmex cornetzi]